MTQLHKLFLYVRPLVVREKTATDLCETEDTNSPSAIFNPERLSTRHAYLVAEESLGTWNVAAVSNGSERAVDVDQSSEAASVLNYEDDTSTHQQIQ